VEQIAAQDVRLDQRDQRGQGLHSAAAPVNHGGIGNVGAHAGKDLVLAIKRNVIVKLGGQDMCE